LKISLMVNFAFNKFIRFLSRAIPRHKMTVILDQGTIIGLQYKTRLSDKPYFSFLGVPYAKPPINDLRFKPPVKHPGWSGELKAFSEGNICMQYPLMSNKVVGSEDCLYLNIFVPQTEETNQERAVMIFIHGGAFNYGSASLIELSPDYLLDENVIVVTINYRLNVLGFLNFDIDECPGNMGLKDQRLAIKWVKENISAFGGDANNITIFGESAGSASVQCHTISPRSTGLFQKAIMQSGSIFNIWAMNEKHKDAAFRLAKNLGCEKDDPKEVVTFLKSVPANDLVKASKFKGESEIFIYYFLPSVENEEITDPFLSTHPNTLIKTAVPIPVITGVNNLEGLIAIEEERMKKIDFQTTEVIKRIVKDRYSEENINKIKNFYYNNEHTSKSDITSIENMVHFNSDYLFVKDYHRSFSHLLQQSVTPVYNYEFVFDGEINAIKNLILSNRPVIRQTLKGACHADELNYLFYVQLFGFAPKVNSPEFKMCRTMSKLWTNFAKTGNPNSQDLDFNWENTSVNDPKYLSIDGDNTKMVDGLLYKSRIQFWEDIEKSQAVLL